MMICTLTSVSKDEARDAYIRAEGNMLNAIDSLLFIGKPLPELKKRPREDINEHEEYLNKMRTTMEDFDRQRESTSTHQPNNSQLDIVKKNKRVCSQY